MKNSMFSGLRALSKVNKPSTYLFWLLDPDDLLLKRNEANFQYDI